MLKYIVIMQLFISGVFAHGVSGDHLHFLNSFHVLDFILLVGGVIASYFIIEKIFKGDG